ncbi:MAG: hypothetical protein WBE26_01780 [Phycisphaerae bacterium]
MESKHQHRLINLFIPDPVEVRSQALDYTGSVLFIGDPRSQWFDFREGERLVCGPQLGRIALPTCGAYPGEGFQGARRNQDECCKADQKLDPPREAAFGISDRC